MFVTVLIKMEGRIFCPTALIFTLFHLIILVPGFQLGSISKKEETIAISLIIIGLMGLSLARFPGYQQVDMENRTELASIRELTNDLAQKASEKIIFVDFYTRFLLHETPFSLLKLNSNFPIATTWGQRGSHEFASHRAFLNQICPVETFISFYDCVVDREDEIIFLLPEFNARLMERYFKILYQRAYVFVEVDPESPVSKIQYSYLWFPMKFGYYRLEERK